MSPHENKRIAKQFLESGFSGREPEIFDVLVVPGAPVHGPLGRNTTGPAGLRTIAERYRRAFPDLILGVADMVAEWDKVAVRWAARGTHRGELSGIAPTGRSVSFSGMTVFRILNGRIHEIWTELDQLSVLQQVGAVPSVGALVREKAGAL